MKFQPKMRRVLVSFIIVLFLLNMLAPGAALQFPRTADHAMKATLGPAESASAPSHTQSVGNAFRGLPGKSPTTLLAYGASRAIHPAGASADPWFDPSWQYRKSITIDHTKVSADLTNFPVLVSITDSDLAAKAQTNGYDILFTDSSGNTKLNHEIESYTSATGQLVAWVKVPSLLSSADTVLFIYYGNPSASNQQNPTSVWDSNYVMVQHFGSYTTTVLDSTGHFNGATSNAQPATFVDGAFTASGPTVVRDVKFGPIGNALAGSSAVTFEGWLNPTSLTSSHYANPAFVEHISTTGHIWGLAAYIRGDQNKIAIGGRSQSSDSYNELTGSATVTTGKWIFVAGIWDYGNKKLYIYRNGTLDNSGSPNNGFGSTTYQQGTSTDYDYIAYDPEDVQYFNGLIDEVRLSTIGRSAAWISTEYNNQKSPSQFSTMGSEEQNAPSTLYVQSLTITSPSGSVGGAVSTGETFVIDAKILASSGSASVTATITLPSGYSLTSGSASQTQTVGTSAVDFTWNVRAPSSPTASAAVTVTASATAYTGGSNSFNLVTVAAASLNGSISASPGSALVGDTIAVTMQVNNVGAASANSVTPASLTFSGTGAATLVSGPTPSSATILGGSYVTFTWTYAASAAGTIQFSGSASGVDQYSGSGVSTGTVTSNAVTITSPTPGKWWNDLWRYRKSITVDHTKISGTLTNFPILIAISDPDLASKALSNGNDIVFIDLYGNHILNYEVESYTPSTGQLVAWVNIPSLSSSTDTVLYMYYGNPSANNQQNPTNVWDSNYVMVQHFGGSSTTATVYDSTGNHNDGSTTNPESPSPSGIIDGAFSSDTSHGIQFTVNKIGNYLTGSSSTTFEGWIKPNALYASDNPIFIEVIDSGHWGPSAIVDGSNGNKLEFGGRSQASDSWQAIEGSTVPANAWTFVAGVWDYANKRIYIYQNGAADTNGAVTFGGNTFAQGNAGSSTDKIGFYFGAPSPYFNGLVDEARISKVARSASWISTEYNNQNNPAGFSKMGGEELNPSFTPTTTTLGAISSPLTAGQSGVGFSGSISPSTVPNGINVELRYASTCLLGSGGTVAAPVQTSAGNGGFTGTFSAPAAGTYEFWAYFVGSSSYGGSSSACQSITVNPPVSLTLAVQNVAISSPSGSVGGTVSTGEVFVVDAKILTSTGSVSVTATITLPSGYSLTSGSASQSQTVGMSVVDFIWNVQAPSSSAASDSVTVAASATGYTGASNSFNVVTVAAASLTGSLSAGSVSSGSWFDPAWQYRKAITIDHTKVSSDLTNFPVLISITDSDLASKAQANGYDILFTDSSGTSKLNHEVESYASASGELVVWVTVPTLSSTADTLLYMYYGNPSASNQQTPTNVWDSNYVMVQHFGSYTSTVLDSTGNHNDGTTSAPPDYTMVDAKVVTDGMQAFGFLLIDKDLNLVVDQNNEAWLYTNDIPPGDTWEGYARQMNVDTFATGPKNLVLQNDADAGWVAPHLVIKIADDFYVMFYTAATSNYGVRAATSSSPNGLFSRVSGFQISPQGWEGGSIEADPGVAKISEDSQYVYYYIAYSSLGASPYDQIGWAEVQVDKVSKNVVFLGRYANNPLTNLRIDGHQYRCGGTFPSPKIHGKYAYFYLSYDIMGPGPYYISRALSSDPLFNTVDEKTIFDNTMTFPTHTERAFEKFQFYQRGNNLILIYDTSFADGDWGTVARTYVPGSQQQPQKPQGIVDGGFSADASHNIQLTTNKIGSYLTGSSAVTFEAWIKPSTIGSTTDYDSPVFIEWVTNAWGLGVYIAGNDGNRIVVGGRSQSSDGYQELKGSPVITGQWILVTGVWDYVNKKMYIYKNGVLDSSATSVAFGGNSYTQGTQDHTQDSIGYDPSDSTYFNGLIDEVRLSRVDRSAGWISTEYNNQNNPSGFYSVGGEEQKPSGPVTIGDTITVTMTIQNIGTAPASTVVPTSLTITGTGAATLASGPTPSSAIINGGDSATFTWTYTATAAGTVLFSGSASGTDQYSGSEVSTGILNSAAVTINSPTVSITVDTSPAGLAGSIVVDGTTYTSPQTFNWVSGDTHTINAVSTISGGSGTEYVWVSWSDGLDQSHAITVPSTATTYTANYQTRYQVAYTQTGCSLTVSLPLSEWVGSGGSATGTFPSPVNGVGTQCIFQSDNRPSTITSPTTVTGTYKTQYYLTLSSSYGSPTGEGWYDSGASASFSATTPVSGGTGIQYAFTGWSSGDTDGYTGTDVSHSVTLNSPVTETTSWKTQWYVSFAMDPPAGGSITVNGQPSATTWYDDSTVVDIQATSNSGYVFSSWAATTTSGTITFEGSSSASATATIQGTGTITAAFTQNVYSLTVTVAGTGSVNRDNPGPYHYGDVVQLNAAPGTGWSFSAWGGDLSGAEISKSITIDSNKAVSATFTINVYHIAASAGAGGSISPSGSVPVNYGADQLFTITADAHYHVLDVLVDGKSVGPVSSYTFTVVTADHTIAAGFLLNAPTVTVNGAYHGARLEWTSVGVTSYDIYYNTANNPDTSTKYVGGVTGLAYDVKNLPAGTWDRTCYFWVSPAGSTKASWGSGSDKVWVTKIEITSVTVAKGVAGDVKVHVEYRSRYLESGGITVGIEIGEYLGPGTEGNIPSRPISIVTTRPITLLSFMDTGLANFGSTSGEFASGKSYKAWIFLWNQLPSDPGYWEAYADKAELIPITIQ